MPKIKNIIIFVIIGTIFILIYVFFIKKSPSDDSTLISSSGIPAVSNTTTTGINVNINTNVTQDFIDLLLSVRSIKLNDAIFSDIAFINLDGSHSITLLPDGNEGRPNPFAPIGSDIILSPEIVTTTEQADDEDTETTGATGAPSLPR